MNLVYHLFWTKFPERTKGLCGPIATRKRFFQVKRYMQVKFYATTTWQKSSWSGFTFVQMEGQTLFKMEIRTFNRPESIILTFSPACLLLGNVSQVSVVAHEPLVFIVIEERSICFYCMPLKVGIGCISKLLLWKYHHKASRKNRSYSKSF